MSSEKKIRKTSKIQTTGKKSDNKRRHLYVPEQVNVGSQSAIKRVNLVGKCVLKVKNKDNRAKSI